MKKFAVRVPASIANLGPGFDTLGLAVSLSNELTVELGTPEFAIRVEGEGKSQLSGDSSNLVARAALRLYRVLGFEPPGMQIQALNGIPLGSGMGSSAAAIVSGLLIANTAANAGLTREELLEHAYVMEGHADNVAACLFGGLVAVAASDDSVVSAQLPMAEMRMVVVLPQLDLPTSSMRQALPRNVPLSEAVFNLGRLALTLEALRVGDYQLLSTAMHDRLHTPYRVPLIPGFEQARNAALEAGAASVTLAGAGPGIVAFTGEGHEMVAAAMAAALRGHELTTREYVLTLDRVGAQVLGGTPPAH